MPLKREISLKIGCVLLHGSERHAKNRNFFIGAVLDNLKMGYEKDNEEEPLKSL